MSAVEGYDYLTLPRSSTRAPVSLVFGNDKVLQKIYQLIDQVAKMKTSGGAWLLLE